MGVLGTIFEVREFCVHDGPGIRTTVFFKGCPLRCRWCHNPEGLRFSPELLLLKRPCLNCGNCRKVCPSPEHCTGCGRCVAVCPAQRRKLAGERIDAEVLARQLLRDRELFTHSGGGVTFSGGEPLAQPEFFFALADALSGVHRAIETSGFAPNDVYRRMLNCVDLVFQDLKLANPGRHRELTGQSNEPILSNLELLKASNVPFIVRIPQIPGLNDDPENRNALQELLRNAPNLQGIQLLPPNFLFSRKES